MQWLVGLEPKLEGCWIEKSLLALQVVEVVVNLEADVLGHQTDEVEADDAQVWSLNQFYFVDFSQ